MASPFQGKWRLYRTENEKVYADVFSIPYDAAHAMAHTRPTEEMHVNDESVHIRYEVPRYQIKGSTTEDSFQFDKQTAFTSICFNQTEGVVSKTSEKEWTAKLCDTKFGEIVVRREIVNGEMWQTHEIDGIQMLQKYERAMAEANCCDSDSCISPFTGYWRRYGIHNADAFLTKTGVSELMRRVVKEAKKFETIQVVGDRVSVRVETLPLIIPAQTAELCFTTGKEKQCLFPLTNTPVKVRGSSVNEWKLCAEIIGLKVGYLSITHEIIHGELWVSYETITGTAVHKYRRCERSFA